MKVSEAQKYENTGYSLYLNQVRHGWNILLIFNDLLTSVPKATCSPGGFG
jgi:hypothetical protein